MVRDRPQAGQSSRNSKAGIRTMRIPADVSSLSGVEHSEFTSSEQSQVF